MDSNILITWGATLVKYAKGELIFQEGDEPRYFYQIEKGMVKMFNVNDDGREFTQGVFGPGECFGEPPLFIGEKYPASAEATMDSVVLRISVERFLNVLEEYKYMERELLKIFARRLFSKAVTAREIINNNPEHRITAFLSDYRKKTGAGTGRILIPFTRQEIANFTGLRVETVIRTLSAMNKLKKVDIINRKLYY